MTTCLPTALEEIWRGTFTSDDLSRVFMTVGDADTLWHPQFFSESHGSGCRSDHWCRVWDPGQACLDDDACISYDFVVGSQADSCRFYSEATVPGEPRSANLRRALRPHCEGGVRPHIRVVRVFGILHAVFKGNPSALSLSSASV